MKVKELIEKLSRFDGEAELAGCLPSGDFAEVYSPWLREDDCEDDEDIPPAGTVIIDIDF